MLYSMFCWNRLFLRVSKNFIPSWTCTGVAKGVCGREERVHNRQVTDQQISTKQRKWKSFILKQQQPHLFHCVKIRGDLKKKKNFYLRKCYHSGSKGQFVSKCRSGTLHPLPMRIKPNTQQLPWWNISKTVTPEPNFNKCTYR